MLQFGAKQTEHGTSIKVRTDIFRILQFGSNGDEPVARDYDGDGKADLAVVRRTGGKMIWYIFQSLSGTVRIEQFGLDTDFTAPGDYDGDGRFDLATFTRYGRRIQATFFMFSKVRQDFRAVQLGLRKRFSCSGRL